MEFRHSTLWPVSVLPSNNDIATQMLSLSSFLGLAYANVQNIKQIIQRIVNTDGLPFIIQFLSVKNIFVSLPLDY